MDDTAAVQPSLAEFETRTFGDVTLVRGDCLDVMPNVQAQSISMFFADLPYGITRNKWDAEINLLKFWQFVNFLKKNAATIACTAAQPFTTTLISSNLSNFRYDIIWHKTAVSGHLNASKQPLRAHEHLLIFYEKLGVYNPQMINSTKPKKQYAQGAVTSKNYGKQRKTEYNCSGMRFPRSVMTIAGREVHSGINRTRHPTQKPVALLEWLIRTYTNDGDTILDPVAGSGTTAIAAMNVGGGRKVICIEKDPSYFEVMCKRIAEHQQKMEAARE